MPPSSHKVQASQFLQSHSAELHHPDTGQNAQGLLLSNHNNSNNNNSPTKTNQKPQKPPLLTALHPGCWHLTLTLDYWHFLTAFSSAHLEKDLPKRHRRILHFLSKWFYTECWLILIILFWNRCRGETWEQRCGTMSTAGACPGTTSITTLTWKPN